MRRLLIPREYWLLTIRDFPRRVAIASVWPYAMELFIPQSWDNPDDPECVDMRKKTYMPADVHYREKWQMALDLVDQARPVHSHI